MRIGIEAQRIFRARKHGMDLVILELLLQLQKTDSEHFFYVFVNEQEEKTVLSDSHNLSIIKLPDSPYPVWEQYHLPKAVKKYGIELLHTTSNTAPVFSPVPTIITLHDIIYMEKISLKEGTLYQRLGNIYRRWNVPVVAKKAKCLITVSEYEKQRINAFFKFREDKIRVIHNGVRPHFFPLPAKQAAEKLRSYNLPEQFILFLGNTDPKKNLKNVLLAFTAFLQKNNTDIKMVMPDFGERKLIRLLDSINAPGLRKNIHLTGYIPNQLLPGFYSLATFFLYPSLRESFGLPVLEAMACGCPVITSNTSSMPEVAGEAAILTDPYDVDAIENAMREMFYNKALRDELTVRGMKRAAGFSYEAAARKLLKLYDSFS